MMKKINKMQRYLVITTLLVCIIIVTVLIWVNHSTPGPSRPVHPTLDLLSEKNNNNYKFIINNCHDPENVLKLNKVEVYINNGSNILTYRVIDILNSENNNITFLDNDNNNRLSVGDEFKIVADIVNSGTIFVGVYIPYGSSVFNFIIT